MREHHLVRSCSWSRTPKRCSAEGITNEFILVDDDDVIILDFPESSKLKPPDASRNQSESSSPGVINIDDDDDDDDDNGDTDNVHKPGNSVEGVSDDSGSGEQSHQTSAEVDDDDCQVIQEKCSAFRFSKCQQTFSKKTSSRNRFGLGSDSEGGLSDSDCSDCEVLEGSNSGVREQWEKAFLRKRRKIGKAPSDLSEEASNSDIPCDTNPDIGVEKRPEQYAQTSSFFTSRNFPAHGDGKSNASLFGSEMDKDDQAINYANSSFCNEENTQGPSSHPDETQVEHGGSASSSAQTFSFKGSVHQTCFNEAEEEPEEVHDQHEMSASPSSQATSFKGSIHRTGFKEVEKEQEEVHVQPEMSASPLSRKNQTKEAAHQSGTKYAEVVATESSPAVAHTSHAGRDTTFVLGTQGDEVRVVNEIPSLVEIGECIRDSVPSTSGQVHVDSSSTPTELDIMLDRAKLKETDEYKKAAEEEWESRQRQLQIQAEEAQRQRKKRKLENMRRIEMEQRQKKRVEEMRETQKKDEERTNMKEKVRAEVSMSLKRLELTCTNMASLLRGLGIPVRGGSFPLPDEVQAAYKRALLKFHPDRAKGDLREQVEAEEKFKLIARMKDKFQSPLFR